MNSSKTRLMLKKALQPSSASRSRAATSDSRPSVSISDEFNPDTDIQYQEVSGL